jgi:membrane-bound ClpP family serine protease
MKKIILTWIGFILFLIIANFFNYSYFILTVGFIITISILLFEIKNNKKKERKIISKICNTVFYVLFIMVFFLLQYNYCIYFFKVKQVEKYIKNSEKIELNNKIIKKQNEFKKEFLDQIDLMSGKIYNFNGKPNFTLKDQNNKKLDIYVMAIDGDCDIYIYVGINKVIKLKKNEENCKYFQ